MGYEKQEKDETKDGTDMESEVRINLQREETCMVCGERKECAEILIWLAVMPSNQLRVLVCQSCWARTLGRFTKEV